LRQGASWKNETQSHRSNWVNSNSERGNNRHFFAGCPGLPDVMLVCSRLGNGRDSSIAFFAAFDALGAIQTFAESGGQV
jgi:hypothetical protein